MFYRLWLTGIAPEKLKNNIYGNLHDLFFMGLIEVLLSTLILKGL
jgi:hypothetical protein